MVEVYIIEDNSSPVEHVRDHLDFGLGLSELHLRGHLGLTAEKERHGECDVI
jgi:hypothetical protein